MVTPQGHQYQVDIPRYMECVAYRRLGRGGTGTTQNRREGVHSLTHVRERQVLQLFGDSDLKLDFRRVVDARNKPPYRRDNFPEGRLALRY